MLTLDVRPSKRLILIYSLIYIVTLSLLCVYGRGWPIPLWLIIILSISVAAVLSLQPLWSLKQIILLPNEEIFIKYKHFSVKYACFSACHQGITLIILHCCNHHGSRYVLCLADRFSPQDFAELQRRIKIGKL